MGSVLEPPLGQPARPVISHFRHWGLNTGPVDKEPNVGKTRHTLDSVVWILAIGNINQSTKLGIR